MKKIGSYRELVGSGVVGKIKVAGKPKLSRTGDVDFYVTGRIAAKVRAERERQRKENEHEHD